MPRAGMGAGDIGVAAGDPVHEPDPGEEVERAVGHRRLRAVALLLQAGEDVVGALGLVIGQKQFQHPTAHRRQAQAVVPAMRLRRGERLGHAGPVVVIRESVVCHELPVPAAVVSARHM